MRDFARLDDLILDDGKIISYYLSPVNGMEQNNFIFRQTLRIGISHQQLLRYLLARACQHLTNNRTRNTRASKREIIVFRCNFNVTLIVNNFFA
jgi:hypothetical protein